MIKPLDSGDKTKSQSENISTCLISFDNIMLEKILYSPGLQHLAEKIFWNLSFEDLKECRLINQS